MFGTAKFRFWACVGLGAVIILWGVGPVLPPFLAGMMVAYLLHPACRWLGRLGIRNGTAAALVVGGFFVLAVGLLALVIPFLWSQTVHLVAAAPAIQRRVAAYAMPWWETLQPLVPADILSQMQDAASSSMGTVAGALVALLKQAISGGFAAFDVISFAVVAPLVGYYLLRDYDGMVAAIEDALPRDAAPVVMEHARIIGGKISSWLRGQTLACLILAAWYATGLTAVGLQFGLLIGLFTGICAFIPFVGFLFGLTAALLAAAFSYVAWPGWAEVGAVFLVGNLLEGYVLTPKLVGRSVGLNEVWVMFAVLAAGHLFGMVGVMFAVPGAAVVGVLVRTGMATYRSSRHYRGAQVDLVMSSPAFVAMADSEAVHDGGSVPGHAMTT